MVGKLYENSVYCDLLRIPNRKGACYMPEIFHETGSDILVGGGGAQNITSEFPGIWNIFLVLAPFSHLSYQQLGPPDSMINFSNMSTSKAGCFRPK